MTDTSRFSGRNDEGQLVQDNLGHVPQDRGTDNPAYIGRLSPVTISGEIRAQLSRRFAPTTEKHG